MLGGRPNILVSRVELGLNIMLSRLPGPTVTNNIKLLPNIVFRFSPHASYAETQITVMIKADGTDSRQVSNKPTS